MNIQEANEKVQVWIDDGDVEAPLELDGLTSAVDGIRFFEPLGELVGVMS